MTQFTTKEAHEAWSLLVNEVRENVPPVQEYPHLVPADAPEGSFVLGATLSDGQLYGLGFRGGIPRDDAMERMRRSLANRELRIQGLWEGPKTIPA